MLLGEIVQIASGGVGLNDADAVAHVTHIGVIKTTISLSAEPLFLQVAAGRRHVVVVSGLWNKVFRGGAILYSASKYDYRALETWVRCGGHDAFQIHSKSLWLPEDVLPAGWADPGHAYFSQFSCDQGQRSQDGLRWQDNADGTQPRSRATKISTVLTKVCWGMERGSWGVSRSIMREN